MSTRFAASRSQLGPNTYILMHHSMKNSKVTSCSKRSENIWAVGDQDSSSLRILFMLCLPRGKAPLWEHVLTVRTTMQHAEVEVVVTWPPVATVQLPPKRIMGTCEQVDLEGSQNAARIWVESGYRYNYLHFKMR